MPDDEEVSNAGNGVPTPLFSWHRIVGGKGSEETSQDHNEIGDDGHGDVGTVETGDEAEIEEEQRGGDAPVDIAGPVDLTLDVVVGGGNTVLVLVLNGDLVVADAVTDSHTEVGDSGSHDDERSNDMIETLGLLMGVSVLVSGSSMPTTSVSEWRL